LLDQHRDGERDASLMLWTVLGMELWWQHVLDEWSTGTPPRSERTALVISSESIP
jgi:hypothetical protein